MQDPQTAPAEVRTLAQSVKMTPIDWTIHPNVIVIIFEQGPKISFPRTQVTPMIEKIETITEREADSAAAGTPPLPTEGTPFEHPESPTKTRAQLRAEAKARKAAEQDKAR